MTIEIVVKFALESSLDGSTLCECDSCGAIDAFVDVGYIDLTEQDLVVGDEIPAGTCVRCQDGLMYLKE